VAPPEFAFPGADKIAHILLYGGLATMAAYGLRRSHPKLGVISSFLGVLIFASLYGASDEFHQYFVPPRSCDPFDWLSDTTGAFLALILFHGAAWLDARGITGTKRRGAAAAQDTGEFHGEVREKN
jgi:VanZ family protein